MDHRNATRASKITQPGFAPCRQKVKLLPNRLAARLPQEVALFS